MKTYGLALLALMLILLSATPVLAQEKGGVSIISGSPIGAGLVIIGAAIGFGKIGAAALEGMARQPEVAGRIQPAMIIIAALLEGATFFGLLVCLIR